MPDLDAIKQNYKKITDRLTDKEFHKTFLHKLNPSPRKGSDYFVDYMIRVLIFLFPLYVYENNVVMGISGKDILVGIVVLILFIYCVIRIFRNRELDESDVGIPHLIMLGIFGITVITFAFQVFLKSREMSHTFRYLVLFLLPFCAKYAGGFRKYYFQLLSSSFAILYISMYRYIFTGKPTLIGAEYLLSDPYRLMPHLMLGTAVTSILYITEKKAKLQKICLLLTAASLVLLFLYGDMAAFIIMLFFIMGLQFLYLPRVFFMKKNMVLLFLYGLCASNAPLITFFKAPGIERQFNLEYSIYIDIVLAVVGLIITGCWEKMKKEQVTEKSLMPNFSRWYKRAFWAVAGVVGVSIALGSRSGDLQNVIGGKALSGFSASLWDAINNSNGELLHVIFVYGIIGLCVILLMGGILIGSVSVILQNEQSTIAEKVLALLMLLFFAQSFFYPFAATSMPEYLIFVGFASGANACESILDFETIKTKKISMIVSRAVVVLSSSVVVTAVLFVVFMLKPYTITIDANDGSELVYETYNLFGGAKQLGKPEREGYRFVGWTGSNGSTPNRDLIIGKGTIGDLSYKANWSEDLVYFCQDWVIDNNGNLVKEITDEVDQFLEDGKSSGNYKYIERAQQSVKGTTVNASIWGKDRAYRAYCLDYVFVGTSGDVEINRDETILYRYFYPVLDVNCLIDEELLPSMNFEGSDVAKFDLVVDGKKVASDESDFCSGVAVGASYKILVKDVNKKFSYAFSSNNTGIMGDVRNDVDISFSTGE